MIKISNVMPTIEEFDEWRASKNYQYSGDEVYQWINENFIQLTVKACPVCEPTEEE